MESGGQGLHFKFNSRGRMDSVKVPQMLLPKEKIQTLFEETLINYAYNVQRYDYAAQIRQELLFGRYLDFLTLLLFRSTTKGLVAELT